MKVVNAFVFNGKTYLPGSEVTAEVFAGKESILNNFLKIGFIKNVPPTKPGKKETPVPAPAAKVEEPAKPIKVPQPIEIKNNEDLAKAVEGKKEEPEKPTKLEIKPVVEEDVVKIETVEETPVETTEEENSGKTKIQPPKETRGRARRN